MLPRVSKSNVNNCLDIDGVLQFSPQSLASNIYSSMELQLLSWINMRYQSSRETLWRRGWTPSMRHVSKSWNNPILQQCLHFKVTSCIYFSLYCAKQFNGMETCTADRFRLYLFSDGGGPLARWIVNFDLDFKDGLVLAALLAAYCPYLVRSGGSFTLLLCGPSSYFEI